MTRSARRRLIAIGGALLVAGCGRAVVEPGPSPIPPAMPAPQYSTPAPEGGPILPMPQSTGNPGASSPALSQIPRVPLESLVDVPQESAGFYHQVARGDTLSSIARRHQTSVEQLLDANGLDAGVVLQPGQRLFVPARATLGTPPSDRK